MNDQSPSTSTLLLGIWGHLSRRRRIQLGLLFVVMLASGGAELVSLGAVLPFLAVLSDPELLWKQSLVQALAARVGFTEASQMVLPATLALATAAVLSALIRLVNLWLNSWLAAAVGSELSCEAYWRTLCQPYGVHVQRNSSEVIAGTTTQIGRAVQALTALLQLTTAALVATALLVGLLLINWAVALGAVVLFVSVYCLIAFTTNRKLRRNSQRIATASKQQIKVLQEGMAAIRDISLTGNQRTYQEIYRQADWPQRQLQAENVFLSGSPRYGVEALGLVAIVILGGLLVLYQGPSVDVIPLLGALALGSQRLLPALQQMYAAWSNLKGFEADLVSLLFLLDQTVPTQVGMIAPLPLHQGIRLEGVHFRYGQEQSEVLRGLDLEIHRGERIGLIGSTGSGKSTVVDILMSLLSPTAGRVLVDGINLHDPLNLEKQAAWRAAIAHVPQSIFLADSSIAENIAFGVPREHIDLELVKQAAAQAQIASFIESISEGYDSFVGERGIRLSGGQRQRLGLARALYKKAEVLVLDEATSALDTRTEQTVMEAINALSESLTVIMIAHRLSTVENCDRVIRLENGVVSADGPPRLVLASQA